MKGILPIIALFFVWTGMVSAEEVALEQDTMLKAEVLSILTYEQRTIPGTELREDRQTLLAKVVGGSDDGEVITVQSDFLTFKPGEMLYVIHTVDTLDGTDRYDATEPYRLRALTILGIIFLLLVAAFGGRQGIRGLIALLMSFLFIFYALLPGILHGYSPILMSMGISSIIIVLGSYITHGVNMTTTSAVIGMILTVLITGLFASYAIAWTRLSGFSSDESMYLNMNTRGTIDFAGLLLGGMLIGLLGVLYDAAIGQAVAVEELWNVSTHHSRGEIFRRAIRIGREHIGALVNTLAIAYAGVALPLILLFYSSSSGGLALALNREIFAAEIVRIIVGSIGVVLVVPITSLVALKMLVRTKN